MRGNSKALGRFAVNKVMNRLIARGYEVAGADYCYDLVVRARSGFKRVEVKTSRRVRGRLTHVAISKTRPNQRYTRGEVDFIVAYLQDNFRNAYFVFPPSVFEKHSTVYLSLDDSCRWEKYRSAWHLIGRPVAQPLFNRKSIR